MSEPLSVKDKLINSGWFEHLDPFFRTEDYKIITTKLAEDILNNKKIWPKVENMFKAFELCPYDKVKCVILGQDPYYTPNTATGLAFGANMTITPPSLRNIIDEVQRDLSIKIIDKKITLEGWAKQGVLLLNSSLTVEEGLPLSHKDLWDSFINFVIGHLNNKDFCSFFLWGEKANKYSKLIDRTKHGIFSAGHPSPQSVHLFRGCSHFSSLNSLLIKMGYDPIDWSLVNEEKEGFFDFMNKST